MSIVRVTKDRYTVDPVYQWDRNQVLTIYGLSLASVPEIHFSNKTMKNAIVKQSSMDNAGVVTVQIPNALLEVTSDIDAYVCTYEGDSFQALYKIVVPVRIRQKPDDFIADDEEKIYSYNALESKVVYALDLFEKNAEKMESYALNPPKISDDGFWMIWDVENKVYVKTEYRIGEVSEEVINNTLGFIKDIPSDSAIYAKVNMLGGMTYKVNTGTEEEPAYELRSAPVTEIESVGVNLANITLPIPEAVQALDGYGEGINDTVYNYVDWEKKQFVRNVGKVDLGTVSWKYVDTFGGSFQAFISKMKTGTAASECSKYQVVTSNINNVDKAIYTIKNGKNVFVKDSAYTDATVFKAAMSGVMLLYELDTPEITDISDMLTDNTISVEGGGTLTFKNQYEYPVPSEVVFYNNNHKRFSANEFVGDLKGIATKAIYDKNGNDIAECMKLLEDRIKLLENSTS